MVVWGFRAKCWSGVEWMEWIPLRLLRLLEHLAVLINDSIAIKKSMMVALFEET